MKARQLPMLCSILTIVVSLCFLQPKEASADKFLDPYWIGANDDMLRRDVHTLTDVVKLFDNFVSDKLRLASKSTWNSLKNKLISSFAENERLLKAFDKRQNSLTNLAKLLLAVGLLKSCKNTKKKHEYINEVCGSVEEQMVASRQAGQKSVVSRRKDMITMKAEEGFTLAVINVLFKTEKQRKGIKANKIFSSSVIREYSNYHVPFREVVDEIVWTCVLHNCLDPSDNKSPRIIGTEKLYRSLCIARVKVLLYIAYLQEPRLNYTKRPISEAVNCRQIIFGGVGLAAFIALVGVGSYMLIPKIATLKNNSGQSQQPSLPSQLTTEWTILGLSTSAALTTFVAVCLLSGIVYYFYYCNDSTEYAEENGEQNDDGQERETNEEGGEPRDGSSEGLLTTTRLRSTISSVVFSALGMDKRKKKKKGESKKIASALSKQDLRTVSSIPFSRAPKTKRKEEEDEEYLRAISTIMPKKEKPELGPLIPMKGKGAERKAVVKKKPSLKRELPNVSSNIFTKKANHKAAKVKQKPTQGIMSLNPFRTLMKKKRRALSSEIPSLSSSATLHDSPSRVNKRTPLVKGKQAKRAPSSIILQSSIVEGRQSQPAVTTFTFKSNTIQKASSFQVSPLPSEHQPPSTVQSSTVYHTASP